ncbi:MAG: two-component system OmpR family sensor kinase [Francisellaceae bacterium]|jgi:two-component system OmpR family sensor kinase
MARSKNIKQISLKKQIRNWMIIITVIYAIGSTIVIGFLSYSEAKEQQDDLLYDVANLVNSGDVILSSQKSYQLPSHEETVMIQNLDEERLPSYFDKIRTSKSGWSNQVFNHEEWRVYIVKSKSSVKLNFLVAQHTELRNEAAWNNCLGFSIPSLLLLFLLVVSVNFIIRKYFKTLELLSTELDKQDPTDLKELPEQDIFIEILPFLKAINLLISRSNEYIKKQKDFINNASHELRSPITALSLQIENLSNTKNIQQKNEREIALLIGVTRLRKLVNQLLDLARIKDQQDRVLENISFLEIIKNTISDLYPLIEEKNMDVKVESNEAVYVINYSGLLEQLVRNVIENAIKYSPNKNKIIISIIIRNGDAIFCVQNFGVTVSEKDFDQIFEPFFRLNQAIEGSGLGLSICQEVAKKLNGKIIVKNTSNDSFIFTYSQKIISTSI